MWRNEGPMSWATAGDMPLSIGPLFRHLVRTYGRGPIGDSGRLPAPSDRHMELVAQEMAKVGLR